ncbi:MAG TPA: DUF6232 family protein [Hyphomonadaceae bacterium]|nr:DUF6232 family protein [Hyphomonadaceae bacterium]HPI46928.1 DUF6232 family protein [Hyphomonadaceae bacterium]
METEILRGAKVRVTTQTIQTGGKTMPVADIASTAFIEADHSMSLAPKVLLILGPIVGAAVYLATLSFLYAMIAGVIIMAAGVLLYRNSWLHHVTARSPAGATRTLYTTSRKGDALLFHAAVEKALELRATPPAES